MQRPKKLVYTRSLGRMIARAAKRIRPGRFHIISSIRNRDQWCVVKDRAVKPMRVFSTKSAAVSFVKKYRRNSAEDLIEIIIHDTNGRFESKISLPRK